MRLTEDIKPITELKTRPAELVKSVNENRRPLVITQHGEASAVLLDIATYEQLKNALLMMRLVAHSEQEARRGKTVTHRDAMARVARTIRKATRSPRKKRTR